MCAHSLALSTSCLRSLPCTGPGAPSSQPPQRNTAAEGTLCSGLLGLVFSRMCTDSWRLPFPSLLAASSAAGRGTPAGGVVRTVYLLPPESSVQVVLSSSHSPYISPSQWASQGLRSEMWTWIFVVMCLVETKPQLSPQRRIKRAYYVATYE